MNESRRSGPTKWLVLSLGCFIPFTAWANAGTSLMWAGMIHMFVGNAVIGFGEGLALAMLFRLNAAKCIWVMVAANYFSAWVGGLLVTDWIAPSLSLDLYNGWSWLRILVGVTFALTLLLEWPFVFFCLRRTPGRLNKSLWSNLVVQSLSYAVLIGWYAKASPTGLYTQMHVVQPTELSAQGEGTVYYIGSNGNVCSLNLNTRQSEEIFPLRSTNKDARLFVRPSNPDTNRWDVLADSQGTRGDVLLCSNLPVVAVQFWQDTLELRQSGGTWGNFGVIPRLGSADRSDWNFETGFWAGHGLRGDNSKTRETIRCSIETPFLQWNIRNATHLPGDRVVFQLGDEQICMLEVASRKIALIAKGHGPVVTIPNQDSAR